MFYWRKTVKITNTHQLPEAIVQAISFQDRTREDLDFKVDHISLTRLIESPRIRMLTLKHWNNLTEDASKRIWTLFGLAVHAILSWSSDQESVLTEQRLYTKIRNWKVSGQYDALDLNQKKLITDYKVTSIYSIANGVKPEWERQLNGLRYLANINGYDVENLAVCAILRDWSSSQAMRSPLYPPIPVVMMPVRVWALEDTEAYLFNRVRLHQEAAYGNELPLCDAETRWSKPDSYAVMKPNSKRAVRVLDNEADANLLVQQTGNHAYVEIRKGQSIRCQRYCAVAKYCTQYQAECQQNKQLATAA